MKTILYRSPYDIGTNPENGKYVIKDDSRIRATLPTLKRLLEENNKIIVLTWVKRPNGADLALSTKPHAEVLAKLLDHPVKHIDDCVGPKVDQAIAEMKPRDILFLENVRFHKEEYEDDWATAGVEFALQLAKGKDLIVFDGFPQAHRQAPSTTGILKLLPHEPGEYFKQEYNQLSKVLTNSSHPLTIIIGGVKAESKLPVIENFVNKADHILVAGNLVNDLKAIELEHKYRNVTLAKLTPLGLDISNDSISEFVNAIFSSKMVFWVGPVGKFENESSAAGTRAITTAMMEIGYRGATTLVAGGDTIQALKKFGSIDKISYISLAGGATLEFLAGKKLPVIAALSNPRD